MIKDEKIGLKVAENKQEAFWERMKTKLLEDIENEKHNIEIANHLLILVELKLKEAVKKVPAGVG